MKSDTLGEHMVRLCVTLEQAVVAVGLVELDGRAVLLSCLGTMLCEFRAWIGAELFGLHESGYDLEQLRRVGRVLDSLRVQHAVLSRDVEHALQRRAMQAAPTALL